jgi:hypothetical protein
MGNSGTRSPLLQRHGVGGQRLHNMTLSIGDLANS